MFEPLSCLVTAVLLGTGVAVLAAGSRLDRVVRRPALVRALVISAAVAVVPAGVWCVCHPGATTAGLTFAMSVGGTAAVCVIAFVCATLAIRRPADARARTTRVLAVAAHPDDLELACGGTLAKLVDQGAEVHALVMSDGDVGGDGALRPDEADRAGALLGLRSIRVVGLPDTRLGSRAVEMVIEIESLIARVNPDVLLTHSARDQHQDHAAVHLAVLRAARRHPSILCFESPSVTKDFVPSVFVDITDYIDVKVAAVATHRDQAGKPYMTAERVRGLAVYRGSQARVRHAEAFEPVRLLSPALPSL
jgi:LmbE family N-acetylglucosaminyl deacetylase